MGGLAPGGESLSGGVQRFPQQLIFQPSEIFFLFSFFLSISLLTFFFLSLYSFLIESYWN
jgi:hypothetical protein